MSVMSQLEDTADIMGAFKTALSATGTVFHGVEIFNGTSENDLFDGYIQGIETPCAVIVYRGSRIQSNPVRTLDISVVVCAECGTQQPGVWELVDAAILTLDGIRSGDSIAFVKGDRSLDIGGGYAVAGIDFEVKDY